MTEDDKLEVRDEIGKLPARIQQQRGTKDEGKMERLAVLVRITPVISARKPDEHVFLSSSKIGTS